MRKLVYFLFALALTACQTKEEQVDKKIETNTDQAEVADQEITIENGTYFFKGIIDHKYPFHLKLTVENNTINGSYYYDNHKKELSLEGNNTAGVVLIEEFVNEKKTGAFELSSFTADSLHGEWRNPKGKVLSVSGTASNELDYTIGIKGIEARWNEKQFNDFLHHFDQNSFPFEYAPVDEEDEKSKPFTTEEIKLFIDPEYDPEHNFGTTYYYGIKYELPEYIVIVFTEVYYPGAFGINNHSLVMHTYTKEGKPIDSKYLGCFCYDNNMTDYYQYDENFLFEQPGKIQITGTATHASHDYAVEEGEIEAFHEETPIKREINLTDEGMIEEKKK